MINTTGVTDKNFLKLINDYHMLQDLPPANDLNLLTQHFQVTEEHLMNIVECSPTEWFKTNKLQLLNEIGLIKQQAKKIGINSQPGILKVQEKIERHVYWVSYLKYQANEAIAGPIDNVIGSIETIRHPINTLGNVATACMHPKETANAIFNEAKERPIRTMTNLLTSLAIGKFCQVGIDKLNSGPLKIPPGGAMAAKLTTQVADKTKMVAKLAELAQQAELVKKAVIAANYAKAPSQMAKFAITSATVTKNITQSANITLFAQHAAKISKIEKFTHGSNVALTSVELIQNSMSNKK